MKLPRLSVAVLGFGLIWSFLIIFILFPLTRIFYDAVTNEAGQFTLGENRNGEREVGGLSGGLQESTIRCDPCVESGQMPGKLALQHRVNDPLQPGSHLRPGGG